jgi:CBS domain-containing protein
VAQSAAVLRDRRISAVPVLDAADAAMRLVSEYDPLARPGHTAAEVMTRALVSVTEHTDVKEVRRPLVQRRNWRVPVLARSALERGEAKSQASSIQYGIRVKPTPTAPVDVIPSTAMRMVERLVAAGMLEREPNPSNRREIFVSLTDAGRNVVHQATERRWAEIARIVAAMPPRQRTGLIKALHAFAQAGDEPRAQGKPVHDLGW